MNQGFFEFVKESDKKQIKKKELTCEDCNLYNQDNIVNKEPIGKGKKKILIIDESFNKMYDEDNIQLLETTLEEIGFDLDIDCYRFSSVCCKTPNNRLPNAKEINICRKHLFETIEKYNPKVIILMGSIALESLIGHRIAGRIKNVKFSDWVEEIIPDQELEKYICPVYHPSYILKNEWDIVLKKQWKKSIKKAVKMVDVPFYKHNYESDIETVEDKDQAIAIIEEYREACKIIAFDYETTGIKPHKKGHRIVTASFSDGINAYSFPFFDDKEFRKEWRRLVGSSKIGCIAHNARYEAMWTETILGYNVKNWEWDTMIAQSILDNRKTTKLKFWVYVRFGVLSYDENVDKYITTIQKGEDPKSDNSFNCIDEAPIDELLKYNALDALFTYKLYEEQVNAIKGYLARGFNLFKEGFQYLLQAQQNGIKLNLELLQKNKEKIEKKLKIIKEKIKTDEVLNKWDRDKEFNFNSSKQLSHLLYDILKMKVINETEKGNASVDQKTLEKIDIPIVKNILRYRKWDKVVNTYIAQYEREQIDGFLHPFFNLGTSGEGRGVRTYRSSSNSPNFQNCFSKDTEILTENGWLFFEELFENKKIKVAQYCEINKEIEFVSCIDYIKKYESKLLNIITKKGIDLCVTKDHLCLLQKRNGKNIKVMAQDFIGDHLQFHAGYKKEGKCFYSEYEIKFIVALQADGNVNKKYNYFDFCFKKDRKIKRFKSIIDKLKVKYSVYNRKNGGLRFYINDKSFCMRFLKWKYFDYTILDWDFNSLKIFCDELFFWDGCFCHKKNMNYSSNIKKNVDIIQAALTCVGKKSKLRKYRGIKNINYQLDVCNKEYSYTTNFEINEIEYNDFVYCVSVPNNNIIVRRNGKVCVTGNCPKRDPFIKNIIRDLIVPRKNNRLIEYDFKGMEVSIAACFNKDPNLIAYLKDDSTDMHRDQAKEICLKDNIDERERYVAKNDFVFAEFYGDYYASIAPNLWNDLPDYTIKHLKEQGIKKYRDFEAHIKEVERRFWEEKFPVYAEWKNKTLKEYERKGYIKLYSGFKCKGPMRKNVVINTPIQGTAFHCLLWTFNNVVREAEKFDKSFIIGQIHDSMLGDIYPEDEKELDYLVWYYGTQKIREHWDWIIVPLKIEKERSDIDGSWAEMSDMGYLEGGK